MKDSFRVFLVIQFIQVPLAILIAWFIQDILHFQFSPITIGICVWLIFTAFVFVLLESPQYQASTNQKKNLRRVVVILSVGLVTLPIILQIRDRLVRPPTVYYVLDATAKMRPLFDDVRYQLANVSVPRIKIAPYKIGIRVYGSGVPNCTDDTNQVVEPTPSTDLNVNSKLASILPSGNGSFSVAVYDTLINDLANHNEPVTLFLITSGTDTLCDPPTSGIIDSTKAAIDNLDISIIVISIGMLETSASQMLTNYAADLHGCYVNISTPTNLSQVIESSSSYCSNYPEG